MRSLLPVLLIALFVASCIGHATALRSPSPATPLWGRWEQAFEALSPPDEVDFRVRFRSPSGREVEARGFWDGGRIWRVRFMPDEEGMWSYETVAEPYSAGLSDRSGTFVCFSQRITDNPLLEHGPVSVAPAGHYFAHRDGTPFFWMGDTAWNGALRSSRADWNTYLSVRRQQRFNVIQFVTTQWRAAAADRLGQRAYTGFESITINSEFFRRIDDRIDAINRSGMVAAPVLLWELGDPQGSPGQLPESEAIKLARYLTARYGAHHVVWLLGGDANYLDEKAERWKRIGRAVFDEPTSIPVFLHPQGMQWPWAAFQDESWLTAIAYQSGHGDDAYTLQWIHSGPAAENREAFKGRPILNLEPPYEDIVAYQSGERQTAYGVRRAVYWSLLATPIAGITYGAHGIWSWEPSESVPLNHEGAGEAKPWFEALHFPGGADMMHVVELFTGLPWWQLWPDESLVQDQATDPATHVSASRTPDGTSAVVYLPKGGEVTLDLSRISTRTRAHWFDPRDGRQSAASPVREATFAAPDTFDWVLYFAPESPPAD